MAPEVMNVKEDMVTAHEHNANIGRKLAYSSTALLLIGSLAACGGAKAPAKCESPRASSPLFPADPHATADHDTWTNGIAIRTEAPTGIDGIVIGYRAPNGDNWTESRPVAPDRAKTIAVSLGNGAVLFSVKVTANEGSAACIEAPTVTFDGPQLVQPLIDGDAALPKW